MPRKIHRLSVRNLLQLKRANKVLFANATPSARHFSPAEINGSFGGDFHSVLQRLNPGNFVCHSHKGR